MLVGGVQGGAELLLGVQEGGEEGGFLVVLLGGLGQLQFVLVLEGLLGGDLALELHHNAL